MWKVARWLGAVHKLQVELLVAVHENNLDYGRDLAQSLRICKLQWQQFLLIRCVTGCHLTSSITTFAAASFSEVK
jgi:hypothetical protein